MHVAIFFAWSNIVLHGLTSVFYSTPFYNRDCTATWKMGGITIEGEMADYM